MGRLVEMDTARFWRRASAGEDVDREVNISDSKADRRNVGAMMAVCKYASEG